MTRYLAVIAVGVAGLCTTAMNWRFSYQLGTSVWDSYTWAVFSVALDVAKWLMLPCAALAWRQHRVRALAAFAIWLIATTYSFTAAIGFAAINRDTGTAERRHQIELRQNLETMRRSPRWQSSAACADATSTQSKEFCANYKNAEAELKHLVVEDNPQTALFARLTGLSQEAVSLILCLFLATACEVISSLGLFAVLPASQKPQPPKEPASWKPPKWKGLPTSKK